MIILVNLAVVALAAGATELLGATGLDVAQHGAGSLLLKNTGNAPLTNLSAYWNNDTEGSDWSQADPLLALEGGTLAAGESVELKFPMRASRLRITATGTEGQTVRLSVSAIGSIDGVYRNGVRLDVTPANTTSQVRDTATATGSVGNTIAHLVTAGLAGIAVLLALNVSNSTGASTTVGQVGAVATTAMAGHETSAVTISARADGGAMVEQLRVGQGVNVGDDTTSPGTDNLRVEGVSIFAGGARLATTAVGAESFPAVDSGPDGGDAGFSPYTATSAEIVIDVSDTTVPHTVNLPCNAAAGTVWIVRDTSGAANVNNITIGATSGAIHGPSGANTISVAYGTQRFATDGTNCQAF